MFKSVSDQRGVAMVTVLLIAAVMTVVASTATFLTVQELRSGSDDRQAGRALAYGEAGIDRMISAIKGGELTWNGLLLSGCHGNTPIRRRGTVATGSFVVEASPVNCPLTPTSVPPPFEEQRIRLISQGTGTNAARRVEQVVSVVQGGLPIGVFAFSYAAVGGFGDGEFTNLSLITPGNVTGRDKLETVGCDVWYTQDQFYGNGLTERFPGDGTTPCDPTKHLPAAVHAGGEIRCDSASTCNRASHPAIEHTEPGLDGIVGNGDEELNCTANDGPKNSAWDGSFNGALEADMPATTCASPNVGRAPKSKFTPGDALDLAPKPDLTEDDYDNMKGAAQATGIYCSLVGGQIRCLKRGTLLCANCSVIGDNDLTGLPPNYFVYLDFPTPPTGTLPGALPALTFNADLGECSLDPDDNRTTVLVARNGSVNLGANKQISGAILAREGRVDVAGGALVHGTIIASELRFQGSSDFLMDKCAINNLVSPFFSVAAVSWRELDR